MSLRQLLQGFLYLIILWNCQSKHTTGEATSQKTICLNMIVKNEVDVIRRSLASCKSLIDYWVIVDTGSTDGTQDAILEFMNDVPGELHERPWKNFGHNRNEALELAKNKSDYILIVDADDILRYESGFTFQDLDKDCYFMYVNDGNNQHKRIQLFNSKLSFEWKGVVHEYLQSPPSFTYEILENISYVYLHDGNRPKNLKMYEENIQILEEALLEDPNNARSVFYLAHSYVSNGNYPKALETFQRRLDLGGWDEEVFLSLLKIANLQQAMNEKPEKIEESYWRAFHYRPVRAESLYYLSEYHNSNRNYEKCYSVSRLGINIPLPNDILMVEKWIYNWGLLLANVIGAWHTGRYDEFFNLCNQLLSKPDLPQNIREMIENALKTALESFPEGLN